MSAKLSGRNLAPLFISAFGRCFIGEFTILTGSNACLASLEQQVYFSGMSERINPRQLVLRRDTATGLTQVGWESDLPVGRFEHLELICELSENRLPDINSEFYAAYQAALHHSRQANALMLEQQIQDNQAKGWYRVPFDLFRHRQKLTADNVGIYTAAGMQLHYYLTHNAKQAWAVIQAGKVAHIRSRYPAKDLDELSYQVWYHQQCYQLEGLGGTLLQGKLLICESGLWFVGSE